MNFKLKQQDPKDYNITIYNLETEGEALVTIYFDGRIEYGPNYTPDKAAKTFWDAISYYAPERDISQHSGEE